MGRSTPRTAFSRVLLPAPLGPRTVTISPRCTVRSTSMIVGVSPYPAASPATVSAAGSAPVSPAAAPAAASRPREPLPSEIRTDNLLVPAEFRHRPGGQQLSLRHDDHGVADSLHRAELVLHHQHGQAA